MAPFTESASKKNKNGHDSKKRMRVPSERTMPTPRNSHSHNESLDFGSYDTILDIYEAIVKQVGKEVADVQIGIICGSGLGGLAELLEDTTTLPYEKIPGFPKPSVEGHKGNLVFGTLHGMKVVCQQGRFHPYEHEMDLTMCSTPVRVMHLLGVNTLIVSNAAGGINPSFQLNDLMIIKDHIFLPGLSGFSPLVGLNDDRFGVRFVSVHDCYDYPIRQMAKKVGEEEGIRVQEGIYVMSGGPQYETPSEVKLFKTVGADALGMSTCHEVTVARQCGIRVFGFSLITNIANLDADTSVEVKHEEVLHSAKEAGMRACKFASGILKNISEMPPHKANKRCFDRRK